MLVAVLVNEGQVQVQVVDHHQVDLLQLPQVLPEQLAHLAHGLDGDFLVVGTADVLHEVDDVVDELEGPLHELVVGGVGVLAGHGVVVLHEFGQLLPDHFQDVAGQLDDELVELVVDVVVGDDAVVDLQLPHQIFVYSIYMDYIDLALDYLVVLVLRQHL